jgi:aminopeptidase Y
MQRIQHPLTLYRQGNVPGVITSDLAATPGVMCTDSEYEGVNVTGKIALIVRGNCTAGVKIKGAASHGARGVILYNNFAGDDYILPTLGPGINVEVGAESGPNEY